MQENNLSWAAPGFAGATSLRSIHAQNVKGNRDAKLTNGVSHKLSIAMTVRNHFLSRDEGGTGRESLETPLAF